MPTVTTQRKMGPLALTLHGIMMFCTLGLWTPVLLAARRGRKTVTTYDAPPAPAAWTPPHGGPPAPYGQPQPYAPPGKQPKQGWQPPAGWGQQ